MRKPEVRVRVEEILPADYLIVFDGGSEGNPGRGYGSYAVGRKGRLESITRLDFPGEMTNNEAEYETLLAALRDLLGRIEKAQRSPADFKVEIHGDSKLILEQVRGGWKAREPRMQQRRDAVRALLARFGGYWLVQQPREKIVQVLGH
jgi:ribonuclease HI